MTLNYVVAAAAACALLCICSSSLCMASMKNELKW